MTAYAAVTDKDWFDHPSGLSRREQVGEVNFRTPNPWGGQFDVLIRSQPLLVKLTSPHNSDRRWGRIRAINRLPRDKPTPNRLGWWKSCRVRLQSRFRFPRQGAT